MLFFSKIFSFIQSAVKQVQKSGAQVRLARALSNINGETIKIASAAVLGTSDLIAEQMKGGRGS